MVALLNRYSHFFAGTFAMAMAAVTPASSQDATALKLRTTIEDALSSENLLVDVASRTRSAVIQMSGPASRDEEVEKCIALVEISEGDPEAIFENAVSPFTLEFLLSESRDEEGLGKEWLSLLRTALPSGNDVVFSIDANETFHFPELIQLDTSVDVPKFSEKLQSRDEAFLRNALSSFFDLNDAQQIANYSGTGRLTFVSSDQATVCAHLLAEDYQVEFNLRLRTYDRVATSWRLDIGCLRRRISRINEFFSRSELVDEYLNDVGGFSFLIGVAATEAGTDQSGWLIGPSGSKNLCFAGPVGNTLIDIDEGVSAWTSIASAWVEVSRTSGTAELTPEETERVIENAAVRELSPTGVLYGFNFRISQEQVKED